MDVTDLLAGTVSALAVAIVADLAVRIREVWDNRAYVRTLLQLLAKEAHEGVHRCDSLVQMRSEQKSSYSRIYTAAWEFARNPLAQYGRSARLPADILTTLHWLYYRFDLVNFNMEGERYKVGAAFAEEYQAQMHRDLERLDDLMRKRHISIPA